jgi:hypothetical protein
LIPFVLLLHDVPLSKLTPLAATPQLSLPQKS